MVNAESYVRLAQTIAYKLYHKYKALTYWGTKDDCAQEAVVILYQAASDPAFDASRGTFSTFLTMRLHDQLVRKGIHGGLIRSPVCCTKERWTASMQVERIGSTANDQLVTREENRDMTLDLGAALARMTDEDRAMVDEYYVQGQQLTDMGKRRGISQQAMGSRLKTVRAKLAKQLEDYREDYSDCPIATRNAGNRPSVAARECRARMGASGTLPECG